MNAPADAPPLPAATVRPVWLLAAVLGVAYLMVHAHAIRSLVGMWDRNPMYSYGYLVVPVSAYMLWARRSALYRAEHRPSFVLGGVALLAWGLLMVAGRLGSVVLFEQLAMLVALVGIVLVLYGVHMLRLVWAPLAYLLLMVPVWDVLTEPLHVPFQNLSAAIGVYLLQLLNIPAYREGTFITLPSIRLEVARACSGVNYLVAVVALGLPLAYMYLRSTWRRVILVGSALVIAALSNSLRVALIGVLVTLDPDTPLHGPGHILHGLFVAGIGHVTLFAALSILGRRERRQAAASTPPAVPAAFTVRPSARPRQFVAAGAAVALLFAATAAFLRLHVVKPVPLATELTALPFQLGDWSANLTTQPAKPAWHPDADAELRRRYQLGEYVADVYVSHLTSQQQGRELLTPLAEPLHREAEPIAVKGAGGAERRIHRVVRSDGMRREITLLWYDVATRRVVNPTAVKLLTLWEAVSQGRSDGTAISVRMQLPADADLPRALAALDGLAGAVDDELTVLLTGRDRADSPAAMRREEAAP
ncbi:MAG TPA: exosortase W [Vicinamibacterales bacterium]